MKGEFVVFVLMMLVIFGMGYVISESDKNLEIQHQQEIKPVLEKVSLLEQHKFYLKEMNTDKLLNGKISGSYLLIGGSIYGQISETNYINVVYFDDDNIIDNTIGVYKITKFNMETVEIVTISKNETPYFRYLDNTYEKNFKNFTSASYDILPGKPRLFLPDGWTILRN